MIPVQTVMEDDTNPIPDVATCHLCSGDERWSRVLWRTIVLDKVNLEKSDCCGHKEDGQHGNVNLNYH